MNDGRREIVVLCWRRGGRKLNNNKTKTKKANVGLVNAEFNSDSSFGSFGLVVLLKRKKKEKEKEIALSAPQSLGTIELLVELLLLVVYYYNNGMFLPGPGLARVSRFE